MRRTKSPTLAAKRLAEALDLGLVSIGRRWRLEMPTDIGGGNTTGVMSNWQALGFLIDLAHYASKLTWADVWDLCRFDPGKNHGYWDVPDVGWHTVRILMMLSEAEEAGLLGEVAAACSGSAS